MYALSDQSINYKQALEDGHYYFENRENMTPLTLAIKSQSFKVIEIILKSFQEQKSKMTEQDALQIMSLESSHVREAMDSMFKPSIF